jgi:hypothetical protein
VVIQDVAAPGLWPIHGDGVLARHGDLVLLAYPAGGAFTDQLLDLLGDVAGAGGDGRRFTELVSAAVDSDATARASRASTASTAGDKRSPAVAAFGPDGCGTAITVYGTAWAEVTTGYGRQLLSAGQPYGRLRCVLPSRAIKVRAGVRSGSADATDRYLRLADGVVRAVALVYMPEDAASVEAADQIEPEVPDAAVVDAVAQSVSEVPDGGAEAPAQTEPEVPDGGGVEAAARSAPEAPRDEGVEAPGQSESAAPDDGGSVQAGPAKPDFISVSFVGTQPSVGVPERKALPLGPEPPDEEDLGTGGKPPPVVIGVYCKNGHFDDPEARYCAVCGIGMAQLTKVPQSGTRPPLGVLVLDDGSVFQLDADYVIGREPSLDSSVADGSARPLRLADSSGLMSRIHARVELEGWQVFVCDLNSANGTHIRLPGETDGKRLTPGIRTPLVVGAEVRLGSNYGFRYDSHRHR